MNKFGIIAAAATFLIIIGGVFIMGRPQKSAVPSPEPGTYEYFWGDGCPHCAVVDEFVKTWEKKDSINIKKMEVWYNRENAQIMADRAAKCGIKKEGMGVPLLYTPNGKCLTGDGPIIELYKSL